MKASAWLRVEPLINLRNHLMDLRDGGRIEISIAGHYQARDFVDALTPAVRLELRNLIVEVEDKLRALGVTLD